MIVELDEGELNALLGHIDDSRHIDSDDEELIRKLTQALETIRTQKEGKA